MLAEFHIPSLFTDSDVYCLPELEDLVWLNDKHLADPRVTDILRQVPIVLHESPLEIKTWAKEIDCLIAIRHNAVPVTPEWLTVGFATAQMCESGAYAMIGYKTRGQYVAAKARFLGRSSRQLRRHMAAASNWIDLAAAGADLPFTIREALAAVPAAKPANLSGTTDTALTQKPAAVRRLSKGRERQLTTRLMTIVDDLAAAWEISADEVFARVKANRAEEQS